MDSGHLAAPVAAAGHQPDFDLLQEVLRGLRSMV